MDTTKHEDINSLVYKSNIAAKGIMQNCLREFELTPEQWVTLRTLHYENGIYNQKELAKKRYKEPASITRTLNLLEKRGLIRRGHSSEDKREYKIFITKKGEELYKSSAKKVKSSAVIYDGILTDAESNELKALLTKLLKGLPSPK